jgi:hypothetical protein
MKPRLLLLTLSLVANAALAFFVLNRTAHWVEFSGQSATVGAAGVASLSVKKESSPDKIDQHTWAEVSTGDLANISARLKAEGFPPNLQRAILAALITEKNAARHKELAEAIAAQPWWIVTGSGPMAGKAMTLRQQIAREEKEQIDQVLGVDAGLSDYAKARRPRTYGDLPAAKISELDRISSDYGEMIQSIRNNAQNMLLPEDREKIAFLEKERRADITKVLTPDEMLEYDLRSSPTANTLRFQLAAFNPSEDEFRALFKLQSALDAQFPNPELLTPEQRTQRQQAQEKVKEQARDVLAPDRYTEFQQKTDQAYIQTNQLITRLQLPETKTAELVAVQKEIMKRAETLRADRLTPADQRGAQMGALGAEGAVRVSAVIGEANLPAYRQSAGNWLNQLRAPAPKK